MVDGTANRKSHRVGIYTEARRLQENARPAAHLPVTGRHRRAVWYNFAVNEQNSGTEQRNSGRGSPIHPAVVALPASQPTPPN
ncbi:hypothetical protein BN2476_240049 [Paraburkholderia piptadeniae]|uniref:Uncharacterized protein n=1 Tax=Paraburkholderia piptadeniae TaxID=1701573 RepID=A0A1N7RYL9_9BURK|nr:hypothetical protein BN2476_240049 [Paraburkholderia piptadeniae]